MDKIRMLKEYIPMRLPFEMVDNTGYAANGPVVTYKLPPEEVERIFAKAKKPEGKPPIHWKNPYQRKKEDEELSPVEEF